MAAPIDFYFDFSSPYGYLGAMRIDALAEKYGRTVAWHPILLGAVFKATGSAPLPTLPMKGPYSLHDFARSARFLGIPYQQPPVFPLSTQLAARATLWIAQTQGSVKAIEFAKAVYRAYFVSCMNISEPEAISTIASAIDLDPGILLEGATSEDIKTRLKEEVATGMQRGVFGSPFVIVDNEPFWGVDRFEQIDAYLKNGTI